MIEPGNVVVLNGEDVIVHSGYAAHEFIRIEIMAHIGAVERDDLSDHLKAMPKKEKKK